jgi:aminoglycoside phosphotransferase family enzyme/predicted kinase
MDGSNSLGLQKALLDPNFYPNHPAAVELIETHISRVYLAGDLVYKCKKPVRFDFLDFSSVELRRRACEAEVRLNRRLAADIYLDVVPVTADHGVWKLEGVGTPVEWLVKMRRLPVEQTLEQLFLRGELKTADIERLGETLAEFYRQLPPTAITTAEYIDSFVKHVRQNLAELLAVSHHLPAEQIRRIHEQQLRLLHLRPELFAARIAARRIVEGHGDLRPEHICLTQPPVIFDCIEFSREFRTLDLADELAFLASECDHLGAAWVGPQLLAECDRLLGDQVPAALFNFYKSYRACVRAKVAALRSDQLNGAAQQAAADQARSYLKQAATYSQVGEPPLLLLVGGLSGTGKSTLARAIGEHLGMEVLRTDAIRREVFGQHTNQGIDAGIYQQGMRARVYDELLHQAEAILRSGRSVILDATFELSDSMTAAQLLAQRCAAKLLTIQCTCPPEIAHERIRQRTTAGNDPSQATVDVYEQQRQSALPWPAGIRKCVVDSVQPLETQLQAIWQELRQGH